MRKIPIVPGRLLLSVFVLLFSVAGWAEETPGEVALSEEEEVLPSPLPASEDTADAPAAAKTKEPKKYLLDLPTALRLADAQNPHIQFARERIRAAEAELERAGVLWLPNLSIGAQWTRHDGQIQDTRGEVITVSRSSLFTGGGPRLRLDTADAYFEPLAARQVVAARQADERATTNHTLLAVALAYTELIRAEAAVAVSAESLENTLKLEELTQSYYRAQKLKEADAERVRAELQARRQAHEEAQEQAQVASVRLAQLLRLDPFITLQPADRQALPLALVDTETAPAELAALALGSRPELAENRALVGLAVERFRRAQYGPLLPSVLLDYRAGGFGGGPNSFFGDYDSRSDFDAAIIWEVKNLGFGDRALRRERDSEVRQAQIRETAEMDRIVAEVANALARARSRRVQLKAAPVAVNSAARSFELSRKLFTSGGIELIRPIEVLQSIQALTRARQDYLAAVIEHNRAQFQLYWALGNPVENAKPLP